MTASEKLQEVWTQDADKPLDTWRVLYAFPEIIALVAAAERLASYNEIHTWKRDGETTCLPELAEPLAALDAALHAN